MNLGRNWKVGSPTHKIKKNKGMLLGALLPLVILPLVIYVFYLDSTRRIDVGFQQYFMKIVQNIHNLSNVISLSVLGNLVLFSLLLRRNNEWAARGVLISTLCYVVLVFVLKFFEGNI